MADSESITSDKRFDEAIAYARAVLAPRIVRESVWPTLAAATFFAVCAMGFAVAAITAPPVTIEAPAMPAAQT